MMELQVPKQEVATTTDVVFTFKDKGGAHTRVLLAVGEAATVQNNAGPQSKVQLAPGTYRCGIVVLALKHMAVSPLYDMVVTANNVQVCKAKGRIPDEDPSDWGKGFFTLTVA